MSREPSTSRIGEGLGIKIMITRSTPHQNCHAPFRDSICYFRFSLSAFSHLLYTFLTLPSNRRRSDMSEKKTNPDCPCTYSACPRHGDCEACRAYHHAQGQATTCEKQKKS